MADRGYIENKIETILAYTAPELVVWKLMVLLEENGLFVDEDFYDEEDDDDDEILYSDEEYI